MSNYNCIFTKGSRGNSQEGALGRMVIKGKEIGAEVVIDVRLSHSFYYDVYSYLIGTALIPKSKIGELY